MKSRPSFSLIWGFALVCTFSSAQTGVTPRLIWGPGGQAAGGRLEVSSDCGSLLVDRGLGARVLGLPGFVELPLDNDLRGATAIEFGPRGLLGLGYGASNQVRFLELPTLASVLNFKFETEGLGKHNRALKMDETARHAAVLSHSGRFAVVSLTEEAIVGDYDAGGKVSNVEFSVDGNWVFASTRQDGLRLYKIGSSARSGRPLIWDRGVDVRTDDRGLFAAAGSPVLFHRAGNTLHVFDREKRLGRKVSHIHLPMELVAAKALPGRSVAMSLAGAEPPTSLSNSPVTGIWTAPPSRPADYQLTRLEGIRVPVLGFDSMAGDRLVGIDVSGRLWVWTAPGGKRVRVYPVAEMLSELRGQPKEASIPRKVAAVGTSVVVLLADGSLYSLDLSADLAGN